MKHIEISLAKDGDDEDASELSILSQTFCAVACSGRTENTYLSMCCDPFEYKLVVIDEHPAMEDMGADRPVHTYAVSHVAEGVLRHYKNAVRRQ